MNAKKITLTLVSLLSICWQLSAQTIDAANSFQMLTRPDGSTKRFGVTTPNSTSKEVRAFHTYGRAEQLTIRFLGDWLDITDEVPNPGNGITVDRIVSKGKTKISNRDVPYCEVRFNIAANATDGNRTVRLRRPAVFGKDETVYTINLQKNIRISSPSPVHTSNQFGNNQSFSITAEGMSRWVRTDQPTVPAGSILSTLLLFTTTDPNRYDFRAVFRSAGSLSYDALFKTHLIMTTGTIAVHMGASLSMNSTALVSNQPPPPLSLNPSSLNFSNSCIGTTVNRSITITNNTSNTIRLTNITISNNANNPNAFFFTNLPNPFNGVNIAAGGNFRLDVSFRPQQTGNASGSITIVHDAGNILSISLSGSGTVPLSINPATVDFGTVGINTTNTRQVTITNSCPNPVTINTVALRTAGTPFNFNGITNGTVIQGNGRLVVNVNYNPTVVGGNSNTLVITPSVGPVINVSLSGNAERRNAELSVLLLNTFYSDQTITNPDGANYNLCPIQTNDEIPINTEIPGIKIRVSNYGNSPSPATTLVFSRGTNTNFRNASTTINVPIIQPGASVDLDAPARILTTVCTVKRQGSCLRCNSAIQPHWNDRGICATLTPVAGDTNTFDDRACIQ